MIPRTQSKFNTILAVRLIILFLAMVVTIVAEGQKIYWIATTDSNWNNGKNWSNVTGGLPCDCTPGATSLVVFDDMGLGNCSLDVEPTIKGIIVDSRSVYGYTGRLDLAGNNLNVINADAYEQTANSHFHTTTVLNSGSLATIKFDLTNTNIEFNDTFFAAGIDIDCTAAGFSIGASTFNGTSTFTLTGSTSVGNSGGNIFGGATPGSSLTTTIRTTNGGIGLASSAPDTFNGPLILSNESPNDHTFITLAASSSSTTNNICTLNGNLTLQCNSSQSNSGIKIGYDFGSPISQTVLDESAVFTLTTPSGSGTFRGKLEIRRFSHNGTTDFKLTNHGNSVLRIVDSSFGGTIAAESSQFILTNSVFKGLSNSFSASGSSTNSESSGNVFGDSSIPGQGSTQFTQLHPWGLIRLSRTAGDMYHTDVKLVDNSGATTCRLSIVSATTFEGDLSFDTGKAMTVTGVSTFSGAASQVITNEQPLIIPTFRSVVINKSSNDLTLQAPINVSLNANFTKGIIHTSAANTLNFLTNGVVAGTPSENSHVDGPVKKTGSADFTFPTGDDGVYRPVGISGLTATDTYTAQYIKQNAATNVSGGDPSTWNELFWSVSGCEYWNLDRSGSSEAFVTLSWKSSDCPTTYVSDLTKLSVAVWNGGSSKWGDAGNGGTNGDAASGTITSLNRVAAGGSITLASLDNSNVLPIVLSAFDAIAGLENVTIAWRTATEINNDHFIIQRLSDLGFTDIGEIEGAGNTTMPINYSFIDTQPLTGKNYYRLKQVDYDGSFTYSEVKVAVFESRAPLNAYPNPVTHGQKLFINRFDLFYLMDHTGRYLIAPKHCSEIDTSLLQPGSYILRSSTGDYLQIVVK